MLLRKCILILYVLTTHTGFAQDTSALLLHVPEMKSFNFNVWGKGDYSIVRTPTATHKKLCRKFKKLSAEGVTEKNYETFYHVACALWETEHSADAKWMFRAMVDSKLPGLEQSRYHTSDIPGDTQVFTYGYGSFRSNKKNYICRYLVKIYIEEKRFDSALYYTNLAEKKYPVAHNCGTGQRWDRWEMDGLLLLSYEGLGMNDSIFSFCLPRYPDYYDGIFVRAIQKMYTREEIIAQLQQAEASIICRDTFEVMTYSNDGEPTQSLYVTANGSMKFFGKDIYMPAPTSYVHERVTQAHLVKQFKETWFYHELTMNEESKW